MVADSGWSTCAETGLCCKEQKLEAGDGSTLRCGVRWRGVPSPQALAGASCKGWWSPALLTGLAFVELWL